MVGMWGTRRYVVGKARTCLLWRQLQRGRLGSLTAWLHVQLSR